MSSGVEYCDFWVMMVVKLCVRDLLVSDLSDLKPRSPLSHLSAISTYDSL